MESWASWLAADRRAAITGGTAVPECAEGSVLLADVSGFTPLTEALTHAHGPKRGAEEVTVHLGRIYEALIRGVDRFAGSVIGFSGDAITCWFPRDDGSRAVAAGCQMQSAIAELGPVTSAGMPAPVGVKVSIAVGPVRRYQVGEPDIQLLEALAGRTVDLVAAAEPLARSGEVVLGDGAATALTELRGDRLQVVEWRDGDGIRVAVIGGIEDVPEPDVRPHAPVTEQAARPWILPVVHERLAAGQGAFLAELRTVTAVFVRFTGVDFSADDAGRRLDRYVRWAQGVLDRHQGTLVDVTIGDKGCYLAAVVGAPLTHPDNAARAVAAALELRHPPADVGPARTVGIGISSGRMRCGAFGGSTRRTYGVQGPDMNLAARLMSRAEDGRILVTGQVADAVRDRVALTATGQATLKGVAAAVETYAVEGTVEGTAAGTVPRSVTAADELVGRSGEHAVLADALDRLEGGGASVLTVEGDAGIGKSRLVDAFLHDARGRGITTLVGAGDPIAQVKPYHPWQAIYAEALGLHEAPDDPTSAREWLTGRLADLGLGDWAELAPLLGPVLPFPIPDTPETELLTGQSRAERGREALVEVLRARARSGPLTVAIDDAQWLDSPSWSLLLRLSGVTEPLLVVLAARPLGDEAAPETLALLEAPVTTRLRLGPLRTEDLAPLVRRRLSARAVDPVVTGVIAERAEGNPFYAEELAVALLDRGLIEVHDGRCRPAPASPDLRAADLPDTVEGVVTSRIDRLPPSAQTTLKVASVLGRTFPTSILRALHRPEPDLPVDNQLDEDLAVLTRAGFTESDGEAGYRFHHAITQDVAYGLMLFAQRRDLHRAVGEHLERSGDTGEPPLSLLAHHWGAAADDQDAPGEVREKAVGYLGGAAQEALAAYALAETTGHLRRQLRILARQPESMARDQAELGAVTTLAFALVQTRGYGDAEVEAAYRSAQALVDRVADFEPLPFILYGLFSYFASRAQYDEAEVTADRLLTLAQRTGDEATASVGHQSRAIVRLLRGELPAALADARESYEIADRIGDRRFFGFGVDFRLYTAAWIALAECLLGYPDRALETYRTAHGLAGEQQPYARGFVLTFAGIPALVRDRAEVVRRADELGALASRYSFQLFAVIANLFRGWAVATDGSAEGLELIDASLPVARFVKLDSFLPWYLALDADARLGLGRPEQADRSITEALDLVTQAGGSCFEPEIHRLHGRVLRARRAPVEEVRAAVETAVRLAAQQGSRWWQLRAMTDLVGLAEGPEVEVLRAELDDLVAGFTEGGGTADVVKAQALLAAHRPAGTSRTENTSGA